ncbi:hypothetical protein [Pseudoalteromonas sp. SG44-1]|uniref:hypothetical protein n=1 Tax=Pseudoalteromonas sp. SG44-1 TaxID=2760964 RepID=UPI002175F3AB|nr:hypothetical protein [Pseudoalteromonas sp. SG44-1]
MMTSKELSPFKPVYDELKIRLAGIEADCEPLGLEINLRNETEEEMFIDLTTQKAFAFDVMNEHGDIWDIRLEPFSNFKRRSAQVFFPFTGLNPTKRLKISNWILELCNWEGNIYLGNTRH